MFPSQKHGDVESRKYPEGHTSKGVAPEVLAPEVLKTIAQKQPEMVPAALDARLARLLRTLCPSLLFLIMRRRAKKEAKQRLAEEDERKKAT
ncbi:Dehydrogenase/reductase SDR family protein 7-like [Durusdinium trenchii]|uniref:Dehydrogenase/reductase SDR family protein 7-like n=1 Tax=Durusdinium trenchii TaxID=1381693 RepID=A0ABP0J7V5_9DINO